jgi:multisubunit Na+/H+ antiporter MnhB subunit
MTLDLALDVVLAAALVWVAWRIVTVSEIFASVVLFIAFGLLMALTWARLAAPDIALAEAAIGAGVTGALLLDAVGHLGDRRVVAIRPVPRVLMVATVLCGALAIVLVGVVLRLPVDATGLADIVADALPRAGVEHPVTAVLLDFRAYDTLLEIGVLLLAAVGALAVRRTVDVRDVEPPGTIDPILAAVARVAVPVMALTAGYLLWLGSHAPGGAFQAGAVLAGSGILVLLAGGRGVTVLSATPLRLGLAVGLALFLLVGWVLLLAGRRLLELPPGIGGLLIIAIELAVTGAVAIGLATLFAAARQLPDTDPR